MMNTMSPPVSKALPTRRSRRITILIVYTSFAALVGLILAADAADSNLIRLGPITEGLVYLGLIPAAIAGFLILKRNVRGIADLPDAKLDERQMADRNRTYRTAYKVLGMLLVAAAIYTMVSLTSLRFNLPLPETAAQGHVVFWTAWFLTVSLPSTIMAWKEPDIAEEAD